MTHTSFSIDRLILIDDLGPWNRWFHSKSCSSMKLQCSAAAAVRQRPDRRGAEDAMRAPVVLKASNISPAHAERAILSHKLPAGTILQGWAEFWAAAGQRTLVLLVGFSCVRRSDLSTCLRRRLRHESVKFWIFLCHRSSDSELCWRQTFIWIQTQRNQIWDRTRSTLTHSMFIWSKGQGSSAKTVTWSQCAEGAEMCRKGGGS